jgi:hypothetical protein
MCLYIEYVFSVTNFSISCINVAQPKLKTRGEGRNIKLHKKFQNNGKRPLPIDVSDEGDGYRFVGENSSDFIRLISNEVKRIAPFYYKSWQSVPNQYKTSIYTTLFVSIQFMFHLFVSIFFVKIAPF